MYALNMEPAARWIRFRKRGVRERRLTRWHLVKSEDADTRLFACGLEVWPVTSIDEAIGSVPDGEVCNRCLSLRLRTS